MIFGASLAVIGASIRARTSAALAKGAVFYHWAMTLSGTWQ